MRTEKLDFWLEHGMNVCFVGSHGTGKTSMIQACFERAGLIQGKTYLYFSGSTLDPWVDFVGVPKERTVDKIPEHFQIIRDMAGISSDIALEYVISNMHLSENASKRVIAHALNLKEGRTYLELVRPEAFAEDTIEAIFIDEYNRSPKKVRNAVMELLQFKSINGKKFPNLRTVWTAINPPENDEYDVEELDPAQQDRFEVTVVIKGDPSETWFVQQYGKHGKTAVEWWNDLTEIERKNVSPRRLDYAMKMWRTNGDIRDVLPKSSCVSKLLSALNTGPMSERIESLFNSMDVSATKLFLSSENNFAAAKKLICESETMMAFFVPLMGKEKISVLLSDDERTRRYILASFKSHEVFQEVILDVLQANQNKALIKSIRKVMADVANVIGGFGSGNNSQPAPPHYNLVECIPADSRNWSDKLVSMDKMPRDTTAQRSKVYIDVVRSIPEKMTGEEALNTIFLLTNIAAKSWLTTFADSMPKMVNILNHAIAQLAINENMTWGDIISQHGQKMQNLLSKLKDANLFNLVFTPTKN